MKQYLIIGSGVAGLTAAEEIRKHDHEGRITILSAEDIPFYYRIKLNEFIAGEFTEQALIAKKEQWYQDNNINLELNTLVVAADRQKKTVTTDDNRTFPYDSLLIATGGNSFIPPIKGSEKAGVLALRTIKDARDISAQARKTGEVVLIGGGLLGLEAGNAFRKLGLRVTVVEFFPRLLPRQLDVPGAALLQTMMEGMGFAFRLGAKTEGIVGNDRVDGVALAGGETLPAQMVIISAGVRPNMILAKPLELETDKGIKVDDYLRTNQPDIYAAGDVAEHKGMPYGIWPAAMDQGKIAGANMTGLNLSYTGTTMANMLKVVGVDLASAGEIDADNKFESRVVTGHNTYKKAVFDGGKLIGLIMLGDTKGFSNLKNMITEKKDISQIKDTLLSD
ncbi:MAG: NAD(P)/FAD-dependent oxidoreductase [Deltaproteobacteria bacterium]|nr:NAD(P)/FAD-dependent oxidoreductase [Deltaproteobacteria bacterium]